MATKKQLLQNVEVRVENWSSFDKSNFNALTAPLGAIVPLKKQLLIPGKFHLSVKLAAQLPPLATDAFLRTHLKVECFTVPIRLCSGSFESWFAGVKVATWDESAGHYTEGKAYLPRLGVTVASTQAAGQDTSRRMSQSISDALYGPHSLLDYLGVKKRLKEDGSGHVDHQYLAYGENNSRTELYNLMPIIAYNLCYDHWYRNKLLQRPVFARPQHNSAGFGQQAAFIPYEAYGSIKTFELLNEAQYSTGHIATELRQKRLLTFDEKSILDLRYRNYGDDYFTSAMPSAQLGNPVTIDASAGYFSVAALRQGNTLQHFAEINQVAGPDFVQANKARYGVDVSMGVAQRPILHGSADFPMFTSGVEQTAVPADNSAFGSNPFESVGARYGRAHAEGSDFVCEVEVREPSYLLLLCSLVPEANYACGVDKDMRRFTHDGSIADLPCSALEGTGFEAIRQEELDAVEQTEDNVFGYQPQYTYHKLGGPGNEVHGLFRRGASLSMFIPQRAISIGAQLGTSFLTVQPTDLDSVMATSGELSQFGVMIDSAIDLRVSEPLSESRLPSLVNPAEEHGKALYIHKGGMRV